MALPAKDKQLKNWMQKPHAYCGGDWRVIVLRPGETIYFPPGTVHFVSRRSGFQTFEIGGHVLQWSGIARSVQVMIDQHMYPRITNEEVEDAFAYVKALSVLVELKRKNGDIDSLGGDAEVAKILSLIQVKCFYVMYSSH